VNKDTDLQVEPGENASQKLANNAEKNRILANNTEKNRILAIEQKLSETEKYLADSKARILNLQNSRIVYQNLPITTPDNFTRYFNEIDSSKDNFNNMQSFSTDQKQQLLGARKEKEAIYAEAKKQGKRPDYTGFWGRLRGAFATLGKYRDEELEIETIKRDQLAQQYNEQKLSHDALKANQEAMAQALAEPTINTLRAATEEARAEKAEARAEAATGGFRKSRTKKSRTKKSFFKKNSTKKSFSKKAGFKKYRTYK
jgi:hypothetical protein